MLVKYWMTQKVVTIDVDESLYSASSMMRHRHIRGLPVMKNGAFVGVVTDLDVKRASASDATSLDKHELMYLISKIKIKKIMSPNPITTTPDHTVDEAAQIMLEHKISWLPVLNEKKHLVGVITESDIFKALISLTGMEKRGIQFGLKVENKAGVVKELEDTIRKYGGRMASLLSTGEDVLDGHRMVYIRMYGINRANLPLLRTDLRQKAQLLYMVDMVYDVREIY